MLIQLPLETWIEILDWLKRRDFLKKLDQLWDREFTPIVQDWLHKYTRNVKIGELCAEDDGLRVRVGINWERVPFADMELPENVTGFKWIVIIYVDSTVLTFLRRMRPLFRNICLYIDTENEEACTRTALRHLMPIISSNNSIEALSLDCETLSFFSANYPAAFFSVKMLHTWNDNSDDTSPMVNWLFTRREDGQPRLLWLKCEVTGFYEKLRERFLDPTRRCASSFFIRIFLADDSPNAAVTENINTGEQLSVQQYVDKHYGLITNYCPNTVDPDWIAKNTAELLDWDYSKQDRVIWLYSPTIGQLDVENEQEEIANDHNN